MVHSVEALTQAFGIALQAKQNDPAGFKITNKVTLTDGTEINLNWWMSDVARREGRVPDVLQPLVREFRRLTPLDDNTVTIAKTQPAKYSVEALTEAFGIALQAQQNDRAGFKITDEVTLTDGTKINLNQWMSDVAKDERHVPDDLQPLVHQFRSLKTLDDNTVTIAKTQPAKYSVEALTEAFGIALQAKQNDRAGFKITNKVTLTDGTKINLSRWMSDVAKDKRHVPDVLQPLVHEFRSLKTMDDGTVTIRSTQAAAHTVQNTGTHPAESSASEPRQQPATRRAANPQSLPPLRQYLAGQGISYDLPQRADPSVPAAARSLSPHLMATPTGQPPQNTELPANPQPRTRGPQRR